MHAPECLAKCPSIYHVHMLLQSALEAQTRLEVLVDVDIETGMYLAFRALLQYRTMQRCQMCILCCLLFILTSCDTLHVCLKHRSPLGQAVASYC